MQPGTYLGGRYEILNHIGSGGMADVYKARCHKMNRFVAIKILKQEYNEDEAFVRRFIAEAQATSGIKHSNIVNILDAGNDHGCHYIVMELCEGVTLKRYIRRYGRLSVRETVDFSKQIARGIQAAHNKGIVHRDIKPQNILVTDSGDVKVADFGIARAATGDTIAPNLMGSVHYLSPEQARGGYADGRSDIYSLGICMYEMATGKVPFDGENTITIALMHLRDEITPPRCYFPDIPLSLERIILKCTMKRPSDRYQKVEELIEDLNQVFSNPDGEYVFVNPVSDDSPTILGSREEIAQIKESMKDPEEEEDIKQNILPEELSADDLPDDTEDTDDLDEEEDEEEEEEGPKKKKMIIAFAVAGGILLAILLIYLIVSSMTGLDSKKSEATTRTMQVSTTETIKIAMPNVIGKDKDSAIALLEQSNLKAELQYEDGVEETDSNLIVTKQQYTAGTEIEEGTAVTLVLGIDPASTTTEAKHVEVPLLINETEDEAVEDLQDVGLKAEKVYATSDSVKAGYVIKQNPTAGTVVDNGFTITITISKGVSQVKVPPLTGLSQDAAKKLLNDTGLELGDVSSDYNGSVGVGEVFKQDIASGTMVDKGTAINVTVSLGDEVSYHYEGNIYITESPFEEGQSGTVKLVLLQEGDESTIFTQADMTSDDFPFSYTFDGKKEGSATVIMYIDDTEYTRQSVDITAVED